MKKTITITITITMLALAGLAPFTVTAGDANAGASAFNAKGCVGCHGVSGKKPISNYPIIGGKAADFISAELIKFRSAERKDPTMNAMAAALSDADIANLAAYLASQ